MFHLAHFRMEMEWFYLNNLHISMLGVTQFCDK